MATSEFDENRTKPLSPVLAGALVFFASGAVLVLEILGVRLLAPFVGSSLDTYTAIIGTVLAGISVGTYVGGRLSDRLNPSRMLGPVLTIAGVATLFIVPAVDIFGEGNRSPTPANVVFLSAVALLVPAAVLSAVSPIVVKLQLASIQRTGSTVGRLSALGTAGAIAGTFLTGFVLLTHFHVSSIILTIGVALVLIGLVFIVRDLRQKAGSKTVAAVGVIALVMGAPLTNVVGDPCETESRYYCMRLVQDPSNANGQYLVMDRLFHSYVDQSNPEHLQFWYVSAMAQSMDVLRPSQDLRLLTIGGGGFTLPRYVSATRQSSQITSLEIDPKLVELNKEELGLESVPRLSVKTGDARSTITSVQSGTIDAVVADAFGNESVPWHLSTVEFARDLKRAMANDGLLTMNVIDFGSLDLLRAEIKTIQQVWRNVALLERRQNGTLVSGNFVILASDGPVSTPALVDRLLQLEEPTFVVQDGALDSFVGNASVLTDDFAPADQLLARNLRNVKP